MIFCSSQDWCSEFVSRCRLQSGVVCNLHSVFNPNRKNSKNAFGRLTVGDYGPAKCLRAFHNYTLARDIQNMLSIIIIRDWAKQDAGKIGDSSSMKTFPNGYLISCTCWALDPILSTDMPRYVFEAKSTDVRTSQN